MGGARPPALRSMTGFGLGEAALGASRVQVEIRSVNHRYFEARLKLPSELGEHAGALEERARRALQRGRVEVTCRWTGESGAPVLDVARARAAYEQLIALRDALSPREPLPLSLLGSVPDLFVAKSAPDLRTAREALGRAMEQALTGVQTMRIQEGAALTADFEARVARVRELLASVVARVPLGLEATRQRLVERVERLLSGQRAVDANRIEQEIVLLADRGDVTEECTRLSSHIAQLEALLAATGTESVGRKLDFLLQEMAREANTIGAKSSDVEIAYAVIELKTEIERMREQAQNIL